MSDAADNTTQPTDNTPLPTELTPASTAPARGSRWPKGFSGNPSGRRKLQGEEREMMELARKYGKKAVRRLAQLMRSANERVAVAAAQALLDRGFGKPAQQITGANGAPLIPTSMLLGVAPIADAASAAAAYQAILGDSTIDISQLTFAAPAPSQALIFDNAPIAEPKVIESAAARVIEASAEDHPPLPSVAPVELPDANQDRASLARLRGALRQC